jgi:MraZ protein
MFYGRSAYNIDKKGRMTVPSKYRDETPDGVVVTKGLDGNLMVYAKETFDVFALSMNGISVTDPTFVLSGVIFLGNSAELTYDSAGRILIPLHLRKLAGIEENVKIIGSETTLRFGISIAWKPTRLTGTRRLKPKPGHR